MPTSCSKQEGQTRLLKALRLTPPLQDGLTQPLGHLLQCLTALRGKTAELWPLVLQLLPRESEQLTRQSSEEPGSLCLTASSWALPVISPQILPFSRLNQPSPSARTCSCICHLRPSTALTPACQILYWNCQNMQYISNWWHYFCLHLPHCRRAAHEVTIWNFQKANLVPGGIPQVLILGLMIFSHCHTDASFPVLSLTLFPIPQSCMTNPFRLLSTRGTNVYFYFSFL